MTVTLSSLRVAQATKQSMLQHTRHDGLLRFARKDELHNNSAFPRRDLRPGYASNRRSLETEGAGNAGCTNAPTCHAC